MTLEEAEQAVIAAAIAHRLRKAREPDWSTNEPTDYYSELAALVAETDKAVDALLTLRSSDAGGDCANCGHGADYHANTWCGWLDKADRQCGCLEFEPAPERAKAEESDNG